MSFEPDPTIFPNNIVQLVAVRAGLLTDGLSVVKRAVRATDSNQTVGVFAQNWTPREDSHELLGQIRPQQPSLSTYRVSIQGLIRDTDAERGLATHAAMSSSLRIMLYNDNALRVALGQLSSTLLGATESARRWGVANQRFFVNEIPADGWMYLSILEFWLETETR